MIQIETVRRVPARNDLLAAGFEQQLHEKLLLALRQPSDDLLARVLRDVFFQCMGAGQGYFLTRVRYESKVGRRLLRVWQEQNLRFRFYCPDNGPVHDLTLVAPLTPLEQEGFWKRLESALQKRNNHELRQAVRQVMNDLLARGVRQLVVPLTGRTPEGDRLVAAWKTMRQPNEDFGFKLDPTLFHEGQGGVASRAAAAARKAQEAKRERWRAARLAAQPKPGPKGLKAPKPWEKNG